MFGKDAKIGGTRVIQTYMPSHDHIDPPGNNLALFAGLRHELKTQLALMLESLAMIRGENLPSEDRDALLNVIFKAATQLDQMISVVLDIGKLETGNLALNFSEGNLVGFFERIIQSFDKQAAEKSIELRFNAAADQLFLRFDPEAYEKILKNILIHALDSTAAKGLIVVNLSVGFDDDALAGGLDSEQQKCIMLSVLYTGGAADSIPLKEAMTNSSDSQNISGNQDHAIGLALVKEYVKWQQGEIAFSDKHGTWSKVSVKLPWLDSSATLAGDNTYGQEFSGFKNQTDEAGELKRPDEDAQIMLIVEDNPVMQMIIRYQFESVYHVFVAENGEQGWAMALEKMPDVIISDVLMPLLDGYGLLKRLKNDERTSHIPVILLTALESKENKLEGLIIGADDYITKPFDIAMLQTKVENVLTIRKALRKKYAGEVYLRPRNILIEQPDERFLNRLTSVIEENIAESDLDIETFAREVGVSRMQLYRKMHALTGMTVKEYIRHFRMLHAEQLIKRSQMTLSEIAYAVGFNDLAYFRKYFKQQFGVTPSEYIKRGNY